MKFEDYIGRSAGVRRIEYTWRDVALYALAVGAHEDDLNYTYEKDLKVLPSFGVIPYWNAINNYPQRPTPFPASVIVMHDLMRELGAQVNGLHMEHEIIIHRSIDPIKGSLIFEDTITNIYDRGPGKGIIVKTSVPVYDEAGNLLCENISSTVAFAGGGFGGPKPPKSEITIPDREPDYVVDDHMSRTQNLLYRLTGDTNYVHVDPEVAQAAGQPRPFMQGLCSFGFACRMGIKAIIPGQPERMTRMGAQMRSICFPGDDIQFRGWNVEEGKVVFQLVNVANQRPVLDKGIFEFK